MSFDDDVTEGAQLRATVPFGVDLTPSEETQLATLAHQLGCTPSETVRLALRVLHGDTFVDSGRSCRLERVPLAELAHIRTHVVRPPEYFADLEAAFRANNRGHGFDPPPIRLIRVNRRKLQLLNGNHRLEAARRAGRETIEAFVVQAEWLLRDAVKTLVLEGGFEIDERDTWDLGPQLTVTEEAVAGLRGGV